MDSKNINPNRKRLWHGVRRRDAKRLVKSIYESQGLRVHNTILNSLFGRVFFVETPNEKGQMLFTMVLVVSEGKKLVCEKIRVISPAVFNARFKNSKSRNPLVPDSNEVAFAVKLVGIGSVVRIGKPKLHLSDTGNRGIGYRLVEVKTSDGNKIFRVSHQLKRTTGYQVVLVEVGEDW